MLVNIWPILEKFGGKSHEECCFFSTYNTNYKCQILDRGNTPDLHVTLVVNLFEGEKNVIYKRKNLQIGVVVATHTPMLKS